LPDVISEAAWGKGEAKTFDPSTPVFRTLPGNGRCWYEKFIIPEEFYLDPEAGQGGAVNIRKIQFMAVRRELC
jgi:hypothetical protein